MPFYKRLAELRDKSGRRFRVVAITTEPIATGESYLSTNGVAVDAVASYKEGDLHIRATPTVIVVGRNGRVIRAWVGLLSGVDEAEVVKSIL
jgi:hypothetical protein